jgi:hypothetical protein
MNFQRCQTSHNVARRHKRQRMLYVGARYNAAANPALEMPEQTHPMPPASTVAASTSR